MGLSRRCDCFIDPCKDPPEKRLKIHTVFTRPKFVGQDISGSKKIQVNAFKEYKGGGTLEILPPTPYLEVGRRNKLPPPPKKCIIAIEGAKDQTSQDIL